MQTRNKQLVLDLIERVWRQGRIDELPQFWAPDCVNHADPSPENKGLAALRGYHKGFTSWFNDFENIEIVVRQQIAEDDRVVTQMVLRAIHKGTRRRISLDSIRIDLFAEGKIAVHWSIADMAGLMRQVS